MLDKTIIASKILTEKFQPMSLCFFFGRKIQMQPMPYELMPL